MVYLIQLLCPLGHLIADSANEAPGVQTTEQKVRVIKSKCDEVKAELSARMTAGEIPATCPVCGVRSEFWEFVAKTAAPGVTLAELQGELFADGNAAKVFTISQQPHRGQVH